jgi:DNA invertase Pin-like site-specific DNA recombinase
VIDRTNGELDPADRNSERPALAKALAAACVRQVPIVVAKVDRLTRSVGFLSMLLDAGVDVRFADLPQIEGTAGRFMLKQMALVAELEAGFISDRTKAALAAAKRRGKRLGGFRAGARLTAKGPPKGRRRQRKGRSCARGSRPCAADHRAAGERGYLIAGHRKRS